MQVHQSLRPSPTHQRKWLRAIQLSSRLYHKHTGWLFAAIIWLIYVIVGWDRATRDSEEKVGSRSGGKAKQKENEDETSPLIKSQLWLAQWSCWKISCLSVTCIAVAQQFWVEQTDGGRRWHSSIEVDHISGQLEDAVGDGILKIRANPTGMTTDPSLISAAKPLVSVTILTGHTRVDWNISILHCSSSPP